MHCIGLRRIELAVANAATRGHALSIAGQNHRTGSETVLVLELAFENVSDDFHVAMRMRRKSIIRRDPVFVDDAQRAKYHPLRIPIVAETESMVSLEPSRGLRLRVPGQDE